MKLPAHPEGGVQVGISDILQWRDCAARMVFGMRRHSEGDPPESWSPENAYGSAVHHCIARLDDGATPEEAVQEAFQIWKQWLEPSDISRLMEDMEKYLAREVLGVKTLLNEGEISVPLFKHPTEGQVWFRARIDRLYQSIENPAHLIHIDYKSSKWAKSDEEVQKDLQLWAYNWSITEWFTWLYPEHGDPYLEQLYDQLLYGQIPTQKGPGQRTEIKRWLITAVTALIADEAMAPTFNEWCPWCPLKMDCPVVQYQLTDWATAKIAALMPREERHNKDGSLSKRPGAVKLDHERLGEYVELLPEVKRAAQVLKAFGDEVSATLKRIPDSDLQAMGRRKVQRHARIFSPEAKREIVELVGMATFLRLADISLASVERYFQANKDLAGRITDLAEKQGSYFVIEDL